jgi:hypothetical protein
LVAFVKVQPWCYDENEVIVKKKDGYYVLSEKSKRNLGGPYSSKEEAKKRLRQVEYFKHLGRKS